MELSELIQAYVQLCCMPNRNYEQDPVIKAVSEKIVKLAGEPTKTKPNNRTTTSTDDEIPF